MRDWPWCFSTTASADTDDALREFGRLRAQYPRNGLLWLESGATALRAGRAVDAEWFVNEGVARLTGDSRPRMFGEEALWYYKRGAARAVLGGMGDAVQDLRRALSLEGRKWVHGRAHFELGKLSQKGGGRMAANVEFRAAIRLCRKIATGRLLQKSDGCSSDQRGDAMFSVDKSVRFNSPFRCV